MSTNTGTIDKNDVQVVEKYDTPKMYKVLLHNDNFTPFDLVVDILRECFKHDNARAQRIMLAAHQSGIGLCGVYAREVAETKAEKAMAIAKKEGFPLQFTWEEDE